MKVLIDSIEISRVDRHGHIEAEIEFYDKADVIQQLGVSEAISTHGQDEVLDTIGWDEVEKYFDDKIQERIDEAVVKALEKAE